MYRQLQEDPALNLLLFARCFTSPFPQWLVPVFPFRAFPGGAAWNWNGPRLLRLRSCPCCLVPPSVGTGRALLTAAGERAPSRAAGWSCLSVDLQRQLSTDSYFASCFYNLKVWKINFSLAFAKASYQLWSSEFLRSLIIGWSICKEWASCSPVARSLISSVIY